jgi:hypothetical protein
MGRLGTCDGGCSEERLDLVRAADFERLMGLARGANLRAEACRAVARELASGRVGSDDWEGTYRSTQSAARAVLRRYPAVEEHSPGWDEPAERATTWWCSGCGGIDAPQPCLGICLWRPIDWMNAERYEQERTRAFAEHDVEIRLRLLLRRVSFITPREGHWEHGCRVLQAEARQSLGCSTGAAPPASRGPG